jgi:hypothetical protein
MISIATPELGSTEAGNSEAKDAMKFKETPAASVGTEPGKKCMEPPKASGAAAATMRGINDENEGSSGQEEVPATFASVWLNN